MIYKFAQHSTCELDTLKNTFPYTAHDKLERGESLTREEKNRLTSAMYTNTYSRRGIPLQGWMFDFSEWVHCYWVKLNGWGLIQVYAPDKTAVRKCGDFQGIIKIVDAD